VLAIWIGTADDAQQDAIARLFVRRQIFGAEEDSLAGAATHVDGGYPELPHLSYPSLEAATGAHSSARTAWAAAVSHHLDSVYS
jgi:hypothetical protein